VAWRAATHLADTALRSRILVVNDDVRVAESIRSLLRAEGYDAEAVFDGIEALETLARWPADLILLDLIMPRLDGWEFLQRRVHDPGLQRSTVLVWSVADANALERARKLGSNECLSRATTTPDQLLESVSRLLHNSAAQRKDV